jgi:hypothetical protein
MVSVGSRGDLRNLSVRGLRLRCWSVGRYPLLGRLSMPKFSMTLYLEATVCPLKSQAEGGACWRGREMTGADPLAVRSEAAERTRLPDTALEVTGYHTSVWYLLAYVLDLRNLSVRRRVGLRCYIVGIRPLLDLLSTPDFSIIPYAEAIVRPVSHQLKEARAEAARERTGPTRWQCGPRLPNVHARRIRHWRVPYECMVSGGSCADLRILSVGGLGLGCYRARVFPLLEGLSMPKQLHHIICRCHSMAIQSQGEGGAC